MQQIEALSAEQKKKLLVRLTRRVQQSDLSDGCWLWVGADNGHGYCRTNIFNDGYAYVHRISYALHIGPIPTGKCVLHRCDTRNCVNPKHLRIGTAKENVEDCILRGPRTSKMKLKPVDVLAIRKAKCAGVSHRALAAKYCVHYSTIERIAQGRSWCVVKGNELAHVCRPPVSVTRVKRIRKLHADGATYSEIAEKCQVSQSTVGRIIRGERHQRTRQEEI